MALVDLEQRGLALVYRNPRLVVTVNRPRVKPIYDQCGNLAYVKTAGSYAIAGRITCEDRMVELMRLSYSYMQQAPDIADVANDITFANIRATANTTSETRVGGADAPVTAPIETSTVRSFYVLNDQCDEAIGNVEAVNFARFEFGNDCRQTLLTSMSTKLALNTVVTAPEAIHDALGGFFEASVKTGGSQVDASADWEALADAVITLNIPGFENVGQNQTPTPPSP